MAHQRFHAVAGDGFRPLSDLGRWLRRHGIAAEGSVQGAGVELELDGFPAIQCLDISKIEQV